MAELIKCPVCGKDVSSGAASCPHCGEVISRQQDPTAFNLKDPVHIIGFIIAIIIFALIIIGFVASC